MRSRSLVALAIFLLAACSGGGSNPAGDDDATTSDAMDAGSGSDDGPGCSALSPRSQTPETFIGPTGLQQRLTALIDGAQTKLDIFMYLWTVKPLAARVAAAKARGVQVRVVLDPDEAGNAAVRPTLTSGNVPTRDSTNLYSYSHAKYMVIDGQTAVIMSMNFNADAMSQERNYGMVDKDADDVDDLQAIFDQDWAAASGGVEPVNAADLSCTRLIVSPTNSKARLLAHINSATTRLDLEVMYLAEDDLRAAVIAAKQRGVAVRVLISDETDDVIPMLKAAAIPVKTATSFMLHAKLIVADDVIFVGSENMSFTSLTKNREVGALIDVPAATAPVMAQFETDWSGAKTL